MGTLRIVVALIALGAVAPAGATTFTYDLTGDPANAVDIPLLSGSLIEKVLYLTDADTGSNLLPGITIAAGDIVNVNIALKSSLVVPESADVLFQLQTIPDIQIEPTFTQSILFSNGGVQHGPPAGATVATASLDLLSLGYSGLPFWPLTTPVLGYSFDAATDSATIGPIATRDGEPVSSATLIPSTTAIVLIYPAPPVPLPATFWLLLSGLGSLWLLLHGSPSVQTRASYIG